MPYFIEYDCDGIGHCSNERVIELDVSSWEEAVEIYPPERVEYRAGGYDDAPVYRENAYGLLTGPYDTWEEAEEAI